MDYTNYHVHNHEFQPEALEQAQGRCLGWKAWWNSATIRGKTVMFLASVAIMIGTYKTGKYMSNRKKVIAQKKADEERWALLLREVDAWVKNGKKFD